MYTVEVYKSKKVWQWWKQRFYWVVRHENGQLLLTSEMYHNKQDCLEVAGRFARICKCEYHSQII
jgi:uncharacterized protein YegP (UPF0339 family)